ncbi:MAG: hypothetical protein KDD58_09720, partial [Bdellovibrionales bacterium]|nr:hypothetical protein [Bdellovibrionales bacterium]
YVDLTTKLIKFLLPDKLVNNDILAEILNKQLIFGVTDYLLVTKNMSEHNLKRKTKSFHNLLEVDENGDILSLYGNETPVNMDNLKFSTIIVEGDKFDLQNKIYQNAQFVYLINTKIDRQELLWLGVAGYLLKHKNVSFAKIHVPSIKLRTVSKIILERIKNLGPIMGWTSVKWSEQKASFLPQARIDGVLAYR